MAPPINIDEYENLFRESLECAICKDCFDEPKQLLCGHTFCLNCIERLDKIPQASRQNDFSDDIRFAVQCPQCRGLCVIPQSGLNTNYVVKGMVEKFRDIGVSHHPAIVSSENSNSKITCETCKRLFICKTCTKRQKENKKEIFLCSRCIINRGHKYHEIIKCNELGTKIDKVGATKIDRVGATKTDRVGATKTGRVGATKTDRVGAITTEFERFNPLPQQQNLIDFDPIPTTSSAAEVASISPPSNIFTNNDGELVNKICWAPKKPSQRRFVRH